MEVTEDEIHTRKQDRYEILERLGEGSFGEVRRGIDTFSGTVVAVKQVRLLAKTRLLPKAVFREVEALKQLSECKFVAKILDVYGGESVLCIVMEYLDRNLADFIERASDSLLRAQLKCFFQMMLQAIAYCHSRSIIHRDIKPSNFLIAKDGCIKLADFGLARIWDRDIDEDLSHQVSTRHYRAPELLFAARRYTSAVDIWSLAVVFVELITLRTLFPSHNDLDAMFKVFQLMGSPTPERWPGVELLPDYEKVSFPDMQPVDLAFIMPLAHTEDQEFIKQFLQLDPQQRLSAEQGIRLDYFAKSSFSCRPYEMSAVQAVTKLSGGAKKVKKPISSIEELINYQFDS